MNSHIARIIPFVLLLLLAPLSGADAQNKTLKTMRGNAEELRREIEEQKKILLSTDNNVSSQMRNVNVIEGRIKKEKQLEELLKSEVAEIDKEIKQINSDIAIQEERVEKSRQEYAEALRRARKYNKAQNKLHFIMSSQDFGTMLRRYRYAGNYMDAQVKFVESLKEQMSILEGKNAELERAKGLKNASLKEQQAITDSLKAYEKEQKKILADLQKQKGKVQKEIRLKENEYKAMTKKIEAEIERILAEERAAKAAKAKAEKAAKAKAAKEKAAKDKSANKKTAKESGKTAKTASKETKPKGSMSKDAGVASMSGNFAGNKKKMPVPITGPYIIVYGYGARNVAEGKGSLMLNNSGVVFEGSKGAKVRSVFEGEVTRVVDDGTSHYFVIVRHDKYLSVYGNVTNVNVKVGDKIKAGDIVGSAGIDPKEGTPRLLFQIWKEKQPLNPLNWLKM